MGKIFRKSIIILRYCGQTIIILVIIIIVGVIIEIIQKVRSVVK